MQNFSERYLKTKLKNTPEDSPPWPNQFHPRHSDGLPDHDFKSVNFSANLRVPYTTLNGFLQKLKSLQWKTFLPWNCVCQTECLKTHSRGMWALESNLMVYLAII